MAFLVTIATVFYWLCVAMVTGKFSTDIFYSSQSVPVPFSTEVNITVLSELECTAKCAANIKCDTAIFNKETSLLCNLLLTENTDGAILNQTFEDQDQAVIWVRQEPLTLTKKDETTMTTTATTVAMVTCPSTFTITPWGCYYIEQTIRSNWGDARDACSGINARLATPDSPEVGQGSRGQGCARKPKCQI